MFGSLLLGVGLVCSGDGADNPSTTDAVPTMTSNTAPSGVCSASSEFSGTYGAFEAFADNGDTVEGWITSATTTGWLQYQFTSAIIINKYTLQADGRPSDLARMCKDWTIEASNTGAFGGEEVVLDTVTGETAWVDEVVRTFTFVNTTAYLYYRIDITANDGDPTYLSIAEMELIETQC